MDEFDVIIEEADDLFVTIELADDPFIVNVNEAPAPLQTKIDYSQTDIVLIGKAEQGVAEDQALWSVTQIEVALDGTVTEMVLTNIKWTERLNSF